METEQPEPTTSDPFRLRVAILIAVVSILGAVVTARASVLSVTASDDDQLSLQELVQQQQILADIEAQIAQDLRLLGAYQEHILTWRILEEQAKKVRNPSLRARLESEARTEHSLARTMRASFNFTPDLGDEDGRVEYDVPFVRRYLHETSVELKDLRPDDTFQEGQELHVQIVRLIGVAALLIASLFFLTLAQFRRRNVRGIFAGSGIGVLLIAIALFVVVEAA